jgi:hypothetical protein
VQIQNNATPLSGTSVTINNTAPTGDRYNLGIVEILPLTSTLPTLSSIGVTPANVTISTGITQQFSATGTYSDGSTQNLTSLVSWASSSASVAGVNSSGLTTGLNAGTSNISAALGGVSGNTNLSVLVPSTSTSLTIWPSTAIPGTVDSGPDSAVELGVKFTSDVSGTVSGIRFYKGGGNTGTHVGNLWSSSGAKLASATFTGESATGWQQVYFATPVEITGNTVYLASYHTNVGHYSDDQNYFAGTGVESPPLHALANGGNGIYAYGSPSAFPNLSWQSSNYWVDVVFTAGQAQPSISVSLTPNNAAMQVKGLQQFKATVAGTSNQTVTWTVDGGAISSSGLYTAPSTTGTYHVVGTSAADPTKSATALVIIMAAPLPPTTIFYDDFSGTSLNSNWTVISRHGEYAQNETECNTPRQVSVANSIMTISTIAQKTTCGDFNTNGSVRTTPTVWPYATGDIQWSNFNFTYGTIEIRAQFPDTRSNTWPATWLLGANCQTTNPLTGDTGVGTCPNIGQAGYTEIDMTECYNSTSPWCQFHVANPGFGIGGGCDAVYSASDTNWHVYNTVWKASDIKQYIDGVLVNTCNQSLGNPMFLIIQTQTGGAGGTPNNAYLPATLNIDYVKVTQP